MHTSTYRITVEGEFDTVTASMFDDLSISTGAGRTSLITAEVDQAGLNGVLDRLRFIGAALVSLDRPAGSGALDTREG
ncbi:MAG: hypothetical protein RL238_2222 [Actinomycetota bacterium]